MNLKRIGKLFMSKCVGTGPSSYKKKFTGPRSHKGWETLVYTTNTTIGKTCDQWKQERSVAQAASRRPLHEHSRRCYWCQVIDTISDATFNKNRLTASNVVRQDTYGHYCTINLHWAHTDITVCCQVEVTATDWSFVQRSPTDCGASLCVIK